MNKLSEIQQGFIDKFSFLPNITENTVIWTRSGDKIGIRIDLQHFYESITFQNLQIISEILGTEHINISKSSDISGTWISEITRDPTISGHLYLEAWD